MLRLEARNRELRSIVEGMTQRQIDRHGADIDEAVQMSLVFFARHPKSKVGTRSVFYRRLHSLYSKRAKASSFDPRDKVERFKCISTI